METIDVITHVTILPNEIGTDLKTLVQKKLDNMYVKKCIKKYGYIIEILDYKCDDMLMLSKVNQFMYLKCNVKLLTLTPKVGEIYYGFVKIIYPQGIFVKIMNIFDTLIPLESLRKNNYVYKFDSFVNEQTGHCVKKDNFVNVRVIDINYDKKNFNCIAELDSNNDENNTTLLSDEE